MSITFSGHNKLSGSIPATFDDLSDIEALFICKFLACWWQKDNILSSYVSHFFRTTGNNMFVGNIKFLCDRNITSFGYDEGELEGCLRTQKSVMVDFFKALGQRYAPTLRECDWKPYVVCNNENIITEIKLCKSFTSYFTSYVYWVHTLFTFFALIIHF